MKKINKAGSILMFVLFLVFFCYGVYMAIYSIEYLATYTATSAVTAAGAFQYVMTSCISYFGFGFVFLATSLILHSFASMHSPKEQTPSADSISNPDELHPEPAEEPAKESAADSDEKPVAIVVPTAGRVVATPINSPSEEIADEGDEETAVIASETDDSKSIESPDSLDANENNNEDDSEERIEMDPASAADLAEELSDDTVSESELFEVEYIYNEEASDANEAPILDEASPAKKLPVAEESSVAEEIPPIDELGSIDKIPSIEELSREIESELPVDIEDEISLDIKDEIPVENNKEIPVEHAEVESSEEHESFRITSDFIKDILESK